MDQGVLVAIKCRYRKKILEELVLQKGNGTSIVAFLRGINMLKVSEIIVVSWNEIGKKTLRHSWRKILPEPAEDNPEQSHESETDNGDGPVTADFQLYLQVLGENLNVSDINEWLQSDDNDKGYEHMNDAKVIAAVTGQDSTQFEEDTEEGTHAEKESSTSSTICISNGQALQMFNDCIPWFQQQEEATYYNFFSAA